MAGLSEETKPKEGSKKKKAPKPPPKPKRLSQNLDRKHSRDSSALIPLNKRSADGFPGYPATKSRTASVRSVPEDPCYTCLRTAVHCYNFVILILGLGVLGIGIWLLVTEYSAREVSVLVGSNLFEIGTYFMIGGGGTIALLAFCGCCGTMREDKCVLAFYGSTLIIVLCSLILGSLLAFQFRSELSGSVREKVYETLKTRYGVDLRKNGDNRLITDAWDSMQRSLQCCGSHGGINSTDSWAAYKLHTKWYRQTNMRIPYVPLSCCKGNKAICTGEDEIDGPPALGPPVIQNYVRNEHLYTVGCYDKLLVHLERNALILGGVAACVPLLLIVGIVVVFCLCSRVRRTDDEFEFDV